MVGEITIGFGPTTPTLWRVPYGVSSLELHGFGASGGSSAPYPSLDWRANGSADSLTAADPATPALPSGWAPGDLHVLWVNEAYLSTAPTHDVTGDWDYIGYAAVVDPSGPISRVTAYWRVAESGDSAPTVSTDQTVGAGEGAIVSIAGYRPSGAAEITLTGAAVTTSIGAHLGGAWDGVVPSPGAGRHLVVTAAICPLWTPTEATGWLANTTSAVFFAGFGAMATYSKLYFGSGGVPSWDTGDFAAATIAFSFSAEYDEDSSVPGGKGARVKATLPVTPGEDLGLAVPEQGNAGVPGGSSLNVIGSEAVGHDGGGGGGGPVIITRGGVPIFTVGGGGGAGGPGLDALGGEGGDAGGVGDDGQDGQDGATSTGSGTPGTGGVGAPGTGGSIQGGVGSNLYGGGGGAGLGATEAGDGGTAGTGQQPGGGGGGGLSDVDGTVTVLESESGANDSDGALFMTYTPLLLGLGAFSGTPTGVVGTLGAR